MKRKSVVLILVLVTAFVLSLSLLACNKEAEKVTGVTLNKTAVAMYVGDSATLVATVAPDNAENKAVIWSSSDTAIATVDANGKVDAVAQGSATITVKTVDGEFTAACVATIIDLDLKISKTAPAIVWPNYSGANTLVAGYSPFSSKFSPFFSKTAYDQDVAAMTQISVLTLDRDGNIVYNGIEGETHNYNGTPYLYTGPADIEVSIGETETVYTITLRDDLFFSDGVHLTIDDVIFSMYALSDPSYTGSSTLFSTNIKGMESYRTNGIDKSAEAAAFIEEMRDIIEKDDVTADEQEMIDWCIDRAQDTSAWSSWAFNYSIDTYKSWGYGDENSTDAEVYWAVATDEILGGFFEDYAPELQNWKAIELATAEAEEQGSVVKRIEGIKKTGPYSMTVTTDGFEATTIYQLGVSIAPLHYYGNPDLFVYTADQFGFEKGDLSTVEAKTTQPMGAGAYKFVEFTDGVVYFERNGHYFKGAPKITNIQFRETTDDDDKIPGILAGTFDVSDPSFSKSVAQLVKDENSNGTLNGDVIDTALVDFLGYGYIGINASRVKVGDDPASDASKNLRRAYATILSVYREEVVDSYYGEQATVINYPISNTSWAAPRPVDDGYAIAYSKDVDGEPIFTATMSEPEKYAAALAAAIDFLKAAGYTYAGGVFTDVPTFTAHIPDGGAGNHPAFGILTSARDALASIGVTLVIQQYANTANFWPTLEGNGCDMWCAAWGATVDPDMYQVYHSSNTYGKPGSTESNHYSIEDEELDEMIIAARQSADTAYRKAIYKQALEKVMEWAVEIPTYQRKEAFVFSPVRINLDTVTPDITTFWGWMNDIELLEMN